MIKEKKDIIIGIVGIVLFISLIIYGNFNLKKISSERIKEFKSGKTLICSKYFNKYNNEKYILNNISWKLIDNSNQVFNLKTGFIINIDKNCILLK